MQAQTLSPAIKGDVMDKGELWDSDDVVDNGVDEDCVIYEIEKAKDGSILVGVRVNAYNIDKEGDCYSGAIQVKLTKG